MSELHVDIKKHMDETLKASCQSLKYSSVQFLLGPLESFLAKVTAFLGLVFLYSLIHESQGAKFQSTVAGAVEQEVWEVQMKALSLVRRQLFL